MKACPFCAEDIQDAAIVCKHCGRDLPSKESPALCPFCRAVVPPDRRFCTACGEDLSADIGSTDGVTTSTNAPGHQAGNPWKVRGLVVIGALGLLVFGPRLLRESLRVSQPNKAPITAPASNQPRRDTRPLEVRLAELDYGGGLEADDVRVYRFQRLLQSLSRKYRETPESIGNISANARNILRKEGVTETFERLMDGMNQVLDGPVAGQTYADYLSSYVVLRSPRGGRKSHAEAVATLRGVLQESGLQ